MEFANRLPQGQWKAVFTGKILVKDIVYYTDNRGEKEVIRHLRVMTSFKNSLTNREQSRLSHALRSRSVIFSGISISHYLTCKRWHDVDFSVGATELKQIEQLLEEWV